MLNRRKPRNVTMQKKFLVAIKDVCYIEDLMILKEVGYRKAHVLKDEIRSSILKKEGKLCPYPMPMDKVLDELGIDIKKLESSAFREKKFGVPVEITKENAPTVESQRIDNTH